MSAKFASGAPHNARSPDAGSRGFLDRLVSTKAGFGNSGRHAFGSPDEAILLLRNFEASGRGWFWATDTDGHLTYISAPVIALLGKQQTEIMGHPFLNLFSNEVMSDIDVLRLIVLDIVAAKSNCTFVVTIHGNFVELESIV